MLFQFSAAGSLLCLQGLCPRLMQSRAESLASPKGGHIHPPGKERGEWLPHAAESTIKGNLYDGRRPDLGK